MAEGSFHIDPVGQFTVHPIVPFHAFGFDLSYTNSALYMTIGIVLATLFFVLATSKKALIPGRMQMAAEMVHTGIQGMVRDNAGPEAMKYFPLIFTIFFFVLMGNLLGMFPNTFTYTSHIIVTLTLAGTLFLFITAIGFATHGHHFIARFLPPGVPMAMAPFIFILELISYLVRPFTLAIRLFANMLAGHMVMKVFAYFTLGLLTSGSFAYMALGFLPLAVNVAIIALEFFVAVLQAVIFTVLTCVYLRDALVIEH